MVKLQKLSTKILSVILITIGLAMNIPAFSREVLSAFSPAFTKPSYSRFLVLLLAAILTNGRRTVSNILRTAGGKAMGDPSSYRYLLSARKWNCFALGKILATQVIGLIDADLPIFVAMDDTVAEHPGRKVWGKAMHRDAVRSSHSYTAYRWGHKWVVLSIVIRIPGVARFMALPILVALYRSKEWDDKNSKRHRTPAETAQILLGLLTKWFPNRKFIAIGDTGFGTSRMARFCSRKRNLQLVSKFYRDAALHEAAPVLEKKANGRPRKKGARLPTPEQSVEENKKRQQLKVAWYGGARRTIEVVSGKGFWHKTGMELVEVSWVFVHDLTGTHRDEYFYTTDMSMRSNEIVEAYTMRWSIETTFQESREYLHLESPKCHSKNTVLRTTPSLFSLYTVVVLLYLNLPAKAKQKVAILWDGKQTLTFSDMIVAVRREIWIQWVFVKPNGINTLAKLSSKVREAIFNAVLQAA